jgi:putative transposase
MLKDMVDFKKSVGIDVGIKNFTYDSDGHKTPNPQNLKEMLKPLGRVQRKLSRRVYGSQNYKKTKNTQVIHNRIARRRKDFLHKLSTHYVSKYNMIVLEKLQTPNMVRNHHLAQSISDASWGMFKQMIESKSKIMLEINSQNTSIECSRCGHLEAWVVHQDGSINNIATFDKDFKNS